MAKMFTRYNNSMHQSTSLARILAFAKLVPILLNYYTEKNYYIYKNIIQKFMIFIRKTDVAGDLRVRQKMRIY